MKKFLEDNGVAIMFFAIFLVVCLVVHFSTGCGGSGDRAGPNGGSDNCAVGAACMPDTGGQDNSLPDNYQPDAQLDNYQPPDLGPQGEVLEALLEPYRWVEGDWTCTDGAPEEIGKTKTVTILGWAGDDKGAEVSGFPSDDYSYVLEQKDGTFTYVGLNWKKEIGTSNGIFTMEGDDWSLEFDGWTVVPDGYHWKFVKE